MLRQLQTIAIVRPFDLWVYPWLFPWPQLLLGSLLERV